MDKGRQHIHMLDSLTANQIAAGEVVERPVSVVKELVENAIDAGATAISIRLFDMGCERIKVTDNGRGMSPADMRMSVLRHATSKISQADDLQRLTTLGFRGEALPSIAAVSRMTIISKEREADIAYTMTVNEGKAAVPEECAAPDGTTVLVERLFYNAPARKKFLKTPRTEVGLISDLVGKLAICCPDIAFTLINGNHRAVVTKGKGDMADHFSAVYGQRAADGLVPLPQRPGLSGYISLPSLTRPNRNNYIFCVNSRLVRCKELSQAVDEAYHTIVPDNRYPLVFLRLELPPDSVDVNVHPGKLEIKLRDELAVKELVTQTIMALLQEHPQTSALLGGGAHMRNTAFDLDLEHKESGEDCRIRGVSTKAAFVERKPISGGELHQALYTGAFPERKYIGDTIMSREQIEALLDQADARADGAREPEAAPALSGQPQPPPVFPPPSGPEARLKPEQGTLFAGSRQGAGILRKYAELQILGQFAGAYILASAGETLYFIDQHAAAERVRYEKILAQARQSGNDSAMLAVPLTLELTYQEHLLLADLILAIRDSGFILEYFGDTSYVIRGVPLWLEDGDAELLLRELLAALPGRTDQAGAADFRQEDLFRLACHSAIRANQRLTTTDISVLFSDLDACGSPSTCPHGRPIACTLTLAEISKRFLR